MAMAGDGETLAAAYGGREAVHGEVCPCGQPAVVVLPGGHSEIPWCGRTGASSAATCIHCRKPISLRRNVWVHEGNVHWSDHPSGHEAAP